MGLDLWFREDVARMLAATEETVANSFGAVSAACPQEAAAYQKGFCDALRAVGVGFGVAVPTSLGQARPPEALPSPDAKVAREEVTERRMRYPHGGCRS